MNMIRHMKGIACALLVMLLCISAAAAESLPPYAYTGDDPVEAAACEWMLSSGMADIYAGEEDTVAIPAPVILQKQETDDGRMTVYGNFWIFKYTLENGVLVCVSGGEAPGVMTMERDGEGWKATALETAGDGEDYAADIIRFSHGDKELEEAYFAVSDGINDPVRSIRTRLIVDYVSANSLAAVAYQDPYWDPIALFAADPIVGSFAEDGSYEISVPVRPGEPGEWKAGETNPDDAAALASSGMQDGCFKARYVPGADGEVTVTLRHYNGIACDMLQTFDLKTQGGRIAENVGGSVVYTIPGNELDQLIGGAWVEKDTQFTQLQVSRNATSGWQVEIVSPMTHEASVFCANVYYDCDLDALIYADGARYDLPAEGYESREDLGEPVETGLSGRLELTEDEAGEALGLVWIRVDQPEVFFERAAD